jgi:hypothetical protein
MQGKDGGGKAGWMESHRWRRRKVVVMLAGRQKRRCRPRESPAPAPAAVGRSHDTLPRRTHRHTGSHSAVFTAAAHGPAHWPTLASTHPTVAHFGSPVTPSSRRFWRWLPWSQSGAAATAA